jgi:oxalate decarboxylase
VVISGRLSPFHSGASAGWLQFLLVFDEGDFSEDGTFLLSETVAHTPRNVLAKNFGLDKDALAHLPKEELYIFPAKLPRSLAED